MRKKEVLNRAAYYSGYCAAVKAYKKHFKQELPILAYHRISDYDSASFNSDIELISATPNAFELQIKYISKHYLPITFSDLNNLSLVSAHSNKPPIIITFDDGFYDNYEHAYPILKKFNVPATFFLVTNVVDKKELLWFDYLAYMIMSYDHSSLTINGLKQKIYNEKDKKRELIKKLLINLRLVDNKHRINIIKEIEQQTNCKNEYLKFTKHMDWNNIKEMQSEGMEFGSHSATHPILSSVDDQELLFELKHSKLRIENELDKECEVFSYPVGGYEEYNIEALKLLNECNYKYACTYEPGINSLPIEDSYQLKRAHIERYTSIPTFKNVIISPFFGYS